MSATMANGCGKRHLKKSDAPLPGNTRDIRPQLYGLPGYGDLFTPRQLTTLVTFSDLVTAAIAQAKSDAINAGLPNDELSLDAGGIGARAYGEAVGVYLACAVDRMVMTGNSLVRWNSTGQKAQHCFGRQALAMLWDYAEPNFFADATGSWDAAVFYGHDPIPLLPTKKLGFVEQKSATQISSSPIIISTDPPYYDNIGYADLSDFFYIWLRRSLKNVYSRIFSTMLVPKAEELVATPHRFKGGKEEAKKFFEDGMLQAFKGMRKIVTPDYPLTVYYAFKQSESTEDEDSNERETASSGWETMLQAIISAGFSITGTWPLRTEMKTRQIAMNSNALASSIAIVCRPRQDDAPSTTRRAFQPELREALKAGLHDLQSGNIAPVDLAQASIGPGIAVYSKYKEVLEADGNPMSVRQALVMINQELDAYLSAQEGSMDSNSRFCIAWFEEYGLETADYGRAETLAKAKLSHLQDLADEGMLESGRGKVRLIKRAELPENWNIRKIKGPTGLSIWAMVQGLCHAMDTGGKEKAASLMAEIAKSNPRDIENIKALAYRAYMIAERKGWTEEALAYNSLVSLWSDLTSTMNELIKRVPRPQDLEF